MIVLEVLMGRRHLWSRVALFLVLTLVAACAAEEEPALPEAGTLSGGTGKSDGIVYEVKDFFRHNKWLPIDDLLGRVAELATDEVNDLLAKVPYANIQVSETAVYSLEGGSMDFVETTSLDKLVTDLAARFGSTDFAARVNQVRQGHLAHSDDAVYAEAEFKVSVGQELSFTIDPHDVEVRFGFLPNQTLTSRTVTTHDKAWQALLEAPLASVKEARGFILPRDIEDVREMKAGESVTLVGQGVLGLNVGANIPVYTFEPTSTFFVSTRLAISAKVLLKGRLDCQLVRGEGDIAWLEVGMGEWSIQEIHVALRDGYGLTAVPAMLSFEVLGKEIVLGEIAEDVVNRYLRKQDWLQFGVHFDAEHHESRVTIQRFEFDLSQGQGEVGDALTQGFTGDLRLAQTLADREYGAVKELVSFTRDIETWRTSFGAFVSSMRFFTDTLETTGAVTIEQGDQAQTILLDQIQESAGKFWTKWTHKRLLVRSEIWQAGTLLDAAANLRLSVAESDKFTARDQVLDHVDSVLLSVVDFETLYYLVNLEYEQLQHEVDKHCDECDDDDDWHCEQDYEDCVAELISPAEVEEWKELLGTVRMTVLEGVFGDNYDPEFSGPGHLAGQLLDLKLALSSVQELPAIFSDTTGRTALLSDLRISMAGLDQLFREVTPQQFEARLAEVMMLIISKRSKASDDKYEKAAGKVENNLNKIREMRDLYAAAQAAYREVDEVTRVTVDGGAIGNRAMVIVPVDGEPDAYALRTLSDRKGLLAAALVDDLIDRAEKLGVLGWLAELFTLGLANPLGFESHHLVAYTLMSLTHPGEREVLVDMDFEEDGFADVSAYLRGRNAEFIGAGDFDLDALLQP